MIFQIKVKSEIIYDSFVSTFLLNNKKNKPHLNQLLKIFSLCNDYKKQEALNQKNFIINFFNVLLENDFILANKYKILNYILKISIPEDVKNIIINNILDDILQKCFKSNIIENYSNEKYSMTKLKLNYSAQSLIINNLPIDNNKKLFEEFYVNFNKFMEYLTLIPSFFKISLIVEGEIENILLQFAFKKKYFNEAIIKKIELLCDQNKDGEKLAKFTEMISKAKKLEEELKIEKCEKTIQLIKNSKTISNKDLLDML